MKKEIFQCLSSEEFLEIDAEDIVVIEKTGEKVVPLYMIEYWEEPNFDCKKDQYRILEYGDLFIPNDWTLDKLLLSEEGLLPAVIEQQGCCAGGIYFSHETIEDREDYENVFDHLYKIVGENTSILKMSNEKWKSSWKDIGNGQYIIIIKK